MNPFAKIEFDSGSTVESELAQSNLSAVVYGMSSWSEAKRINNLTRATEAPMAFYCVNSSGLVGFCFADLGASLSFKQASRDPN